MVGDTAAIRHLAQSLRERADDVRAESRRLGRRVEAVPWEGRAADAMREQARRRAAALTDTARLHDEAADALDRHAAAVDDALAAVAGVAAGILGEVGEIGAAVRGGLAAVA